MALAGLAATALLIGLLTAGGGGGGGGGPSGGGERAAVGPASPPELPRGGRRILPDHLVVGFYGAPQSEELGALGMGTPEQAAARLSRQARGYRRNGRRILPAFELLATIASGAPGEGAMYRNRQKPGVIDRYLRAARRARALLLLDIQPGRADFMSEVRALEPYLREPDVSLALDPEWSMDAGEVPGQTIGSTDAETVNRVSAHLAEIVRRERLPQKLLLVHQFTDDMIQNKPALKRRPEVALTLNVDGFGDQPAKIAKYREFTNGERRFFTGLKLFYREDTNLMTPREVLGLRPRPDVVVYE